MRKVHRSTADRVVPRAENVHSVENDNLVEAGGGRTLPFVEKAPEGDRFAPDPDEMRRERLVHRRRAYNDPFGVDNRRPRHQADRGDHECFDVGGIVSAPVVLCRPAHKVVFALRSGGRAQCSLWEEGEHPRRRPGEKVCDVSPPLLDLVPLLLGQIVPERVSQPSADDLAVLLAGGN